MTKLPFNERLGKSPLVTDGSIAIELQKRGCNELPTDLYNLKNPVVLENIYREFLNAGAELLKTNTQHANRLALEKFGLSDKVYEINRKGVWIARTVSLHKGYVAGVVGPTGRFFKPIGTLTDSEAKEVFIEQIIALLDGGAEVLMLKSFVDIHELEIAIEAAQFVTSDIPIIALKAFPEDGSVLATSFPADIARALESHNLAAFGASSTVGPNRMLDIIKSINGTNVPLCSLPDIAIPTLVDGRANYNAEPDYVARVALKLVQAGVSIIGADGGASVEHIKEIASIVKNVIISEAKIPPKAPKIVPSFENQPDERSEFERNIGSKFMATVEVEIPRGLDMQPVITTAQFLKDNGIDAVNVFDGARARVRISPIAISHLIQSQVGIECITHLACRDRNMVGLQSDLIGGYALGLRNILAITGDPTSIGDYPNATSVYDVDSIGLVRTINRMNSGNDLMGNTLGKPTQFSISCACNPGTDDLEREVRRLELKAEEGAKIVFSQPIFELKTLETFLNKTQHLKLHFMLGIIPLRTARHAEFLHYEVPGMVVPAWVRARMNASSGNVEKSMHEGMTIAVEFLREAKHLVSGVYIMPPAKKYQMAIEMLGLL